MNTEILAGQWKQLKGTTKAKWAKLTDDDLIEAEGNYKKLVGSIQKRYGYTRERAEDEVKQWLESSPSNEAEWSRAR